LASVDSGPLGSPSAATAAIEDLKQQEAITAPDGAWLVSLARELVEQRLAADSHTVTEIRSVYRWAGEVHDRPEARLALHTRTELVPALTRYVRERHPYEVPCVIAWSIEGGNPDYLAWIIAETRAAGDNDQG
jgi:periplasmic divalent cation tolerance protein